MTEGQVSAPIFQFTTSATLAPDSYAGVSFTMTGPGETAAAWHLPVRGDLAHIRLAGRYFVPHYAVPMPQRVKAPGAILRKTDKPDAEEVEPLAAGAVFN